MFSSGMFSAICCRLLGPNPPQFLRWQLITAFDVATECILVLLSVFIVLPVQISFLLKCQVVFAFAFRLP